MFCADIIKVTKQRRMLFMLNFTQINATNDALRGISVQENEDSLLVVAKKEIIVPEKRIVLLDQVTEEEARLLGLTY